MHIAAAAISQGSTVLSAQVSRQQLSADWRRRLQVIQSKAAQAWGSLPTHVATSLQPADQLGSDGASPDYFVACQVHHYRLRRPGAHILQAYLAKGSAPCGAGICSLAQPIHGEFEKLNALHAQARDALAVGAGKTVLGYLKGEAGTWDAIVRAYQSKGAR